eukprot:CAMPEP_0197433350 /NCGR_PEP_ID=MMETSP1175-20131217/1253_1 /TAXON_ID=1003142 /ORGANISM="Triceratium dubium, Strain CCMP147" /LENGTH=314 /DNA_ID=CAMNT_0042961701 /DNA_START=193 /DNA_END=1137 /DNA_ORIENTATION=+
MEIDTREQGGQKHRQSDQSDYTDEPLVAFPSRTNCCARLFHEARRPLFSCDEGADTALNVEASFAPQPIVKSFILRLIFFLYLISVMIQDILQTPKHNRFIYMGYLTRWSQVISIAYALCATIATMWRACLAQPNAGESPRFWVRLTWALYAIAAPLSVIVVLLFWTLDYTPDDDVTYRMVANHGLTCAFVLFDGNVVAMIPLRLKQIIFTELVAVAYVIWSVIHAFTGIGDGSWPEEDPEEEDFALYDVLDWRENPGKATIVSLVVIIVVVPLIYLLCWSLSMWSKWCTFDGSRRRVVISKPEEQSSQEEELV